jgi:hypothetical protein
MKKLLLLFFYVFSLSTFGATVTWTGRGGDNKWDNAANWNSGSVPDAGDVVIIEKSGKPIIDDNMILYKYASILIKNNCTLTLNATSSKPYTLQATGQINVQVGGKINISNTYPTIKAKNFKIFGEINNKEQ